MMTKNKTAAKKTEDQSVVYKVPAAFVLMIVVIYAFWKLGGYYSTVEGFTALYPMFCVQRYVFLALTAAELVLCVLLKNGLARTICRYWLAAFALLFVSSLILSIFWTGNMIVIYLLHALVYCLYMVWQLYHSEFFTFSLVTASAGVVFYLIARTSYMANRIAGSALLALILIGTALTAFLCAKNHGKLNLGSRMLRLFPDGFNPLLFYFICVLWAVVLAACLIFGSGFAFYAMFAAIAVELIGAVQLLLSVSAFATTLGLAGMRVAASCLCAQAHGRREPAQVQLAAAHCLGFVLVTSTLAAAGLYWAAPVLAGRVLHEPAAVGSLRLLAGLLPAGCAGLVLGGYLTAVGKVWQLTAIDAGERVLGLGLSLLLLRFAPQTVSGACFALLGGELLSSCAADAALYALYRQSWRGVRQTDAPGMARRVGALAAPLALNDLLRAALRALEQFLIPWGLTRAGATRMGAMAAYGTVMGMVFPALMLPSAFLYALVDLLIPELAACRAQGRRERLASVTGQCLRAGLLFAGFTAGLLYALAEPLTAILYQSEQAGRLLRVFAPLALVLYLDALTDGMLKGLSEQVANVRYNTLTSALDAVLLVLLLPRWGLGGYIFAFAATHLLNFTLSLRRLLIVTGCPLRLGAALGVGACTGAGALAAQLLPELESDPAGLLLRAAVFSGVFILAACLSGTAERCLPPSLRGLLYLPERSEKTQAVR